MRRRRYLKHATVGLVALTGCTGTEDNTTGETAQPTSAETEKPTNQQLFSQRFSVRAISIDENYDGSTTCIEMSSGNLHFYDREGDVTKHVSHKEDSAFVTVSDSGDKAVVTRDGDSEVTMVEKGGEENHLTYSNEWWAVQATGNLDRVAVSNFPQSGTGNISYVKNEEELWERDLADSVGYSLALSESGSRIAVGAAKYWESVDSNESVGMSGVILLNEDGDQIWEYDTGPGTESDVISIEISDKSEIIAAGLDDGRLVALDLQGELLWEKESLGGWITMSREGSTIVTPTANGLVALDPSGNEIWRNNSYTGLGEFVSVDEKGNRVIVSNFSGENVSVFEQGEKMWTHSYGRLGPGYSISEDGSAWGVLFVDGNQDAVDVYTKPQ